MNQPILNNPEELKKFKDNEEAREWGKETSALWFKNLTRSEKQALNDYINPKKTRQLKIQSYLNFTKGHLISKNHFLYKIYRKLFNIEKLNQEITTIDNCLKKISTNEKIVVYQRVKENFFSLNINQLRDEKSKKINDEKFNTFVENWKDKKFLQYDYLLTDLVKNQQYNKYPILIEYILPKNIYGAFIEQKTYNKINSKMLVSRTNLFKLKNISIINEQTCQTVKVELELSLF